MARNVYRYVLDRNGLPVFTHGRDQALAACRSATTPTFAWTTSPTATGSRSATSTSRFSRTDHPVETLAVLAEADGASLVYSADTGPGLVARRPSASALTWRCSRPRSTA